MAHLKIVHFCSLGLTLTRCRVRIQITDNPNALLHPNTSGVTSQLLLDTLFQHTQQPTQDTERTYEHLQSEFSAGFSKIKLHSCDWIKVNQHILLSTTNKMLRYTIFFIIDNALHVSGGFSAHHQEHKNCTHSIGYMPGLLATTASGSCKQTWPIPDDVCTVLVLLMMGVETAGNM